MENFKNVPSENYKKEYWIEDIQSTKVTRLQIIIFIQREYVSN